MNEKRENVVRFRVTKAEQKEIESRAIGNVSTWLRDLALDQPLRKKPKPVNPELIYHLNKIGSNLNQIARYCNQQSIFESSDKLDLLFILSAIDEKLEKMRADYAY